MARVSTLPSQAPATIGFGSSTWANEPPTEAERAKVKAERALMRAILNNNVSDFNKILADNSDMIDINFESSGKMTPIHAAMAHGRVDMASSLIGKKANLLAINSVGFTPLMSAVNNGHEACVQVALKGGASKSVKSARGESVIQLATSKNFNNIVNLLK
jgi:ankyrin repeat protein